jgi:hypothetical protein
MRHYDEKKGPGKLSLRNIIEGGRDAHIEMLAKAARDFWQPMFVSFYNEME